MENKILTIIACLPHLLSPPSLIHIFFYTWLPQQHFAFFCFYVSLQNSFLQLYINPCIIEKKWRQRNPRKINRELSLLPFPFIPPFSHPRGASTSMHLQLQTTISWPKRFNQGSTPPPPLSRGSLKSKKVSLQHYLKSQFIYHSQIFISSVGIKRLSSFIYIFIRIFHNDAK